MNISKKYINYKILESNWSPVFPITGVALGSAYNGYKVDNLNRLYNMCDNDECREKLKKKYRFLINHPYLDLAKDISIGAVLGLGGAVGFEKLLERPNYVQPDLRDAWKKIQKQIQQQTARQLPPTVKDPNKSPIMTPDEEQELEELNKQNNKGK